MIQRVGDEQGRAATEAEQGGPPGYCRRQLPGPRGSPQDPQAPGPAAMLELLPEECAANVDSCFSSSGSSQAGHVSGCRPFNTMASKR